MTRFLTLITALTFTLLAAPSFAQCNDQLLDTSLGAIEKFTYLKDFKVRLKKSKKTKPAVAQYTVVLSKGTKYRFSTANASEFDGKLIFDLFDDSGLVVSSYDKTNNKSYSVVDITCKKTGRYYVAFYFTEGKEGCGVGVLSFMNKTASLEDLLNYE
jgi:hypothetical protein